MLEFIRLGFITAETSQWFIFQIYVIFVWAVMLPRMILAGLFYYKEKNKKIPLCHTQLDATVVLTIYKEDPKILEKCISRVNKQLSERDSEYSIIAIIDGWDKSKENLTLYEIAKRYSSLVLTTNARNKRKNLRAMFIEARKHNILYENTIFLDSDTIPSNDETITHLLTPFSNPGIGGVTSAQLIHNPKTLIQKISFWLEDARLNSSMAAASLFGQVVCLPGRMYAVRTKLVENKMDQLVNDSFSYFGFMKRACIAGDDRVVTNFVLRSGYKTVLAPKAKVTTYAPDTWNTTRKMWTRWGRTSQGYTLRSPWLLRYPFAFFLSWSDILLTIFTVYIVGIHWPYNIFFGNSDIIFIQAMLLAFLGMLMTMSIRQAPHLYQHKRDWKILPAFVLVVTLAQFIRFWSLLTQHKVGVWGSREGTETLDKDDYVQVVFKKAIHLKIVKSKTADNNKRALPSILTAGTSKTLPLEDDKFHAIQK